MKKVNLEFPEEKTVEIKPFTPKPSRIMSAKNLPKTETKPYKAPFKEIEWITQPNTLNYTETNQKKLEKEMVTAVKKAKEKNFIQLNRHSVKTEAKYQGKSHIRVKYYKNGQSRIIDFNENRPVWAQEAVENYIFDPKKLDKKKMRPQSSAFPIKHSTQQSNEIKIKEIVENSWKSVAAKVYRLIIISGNG